VFTLKKKNAGLFSPNPILGQIWTNSNIGLKNVTQWLGLSICDPKLGENNLAFF